MTFEEGFRRFFAEDNVLYLFFYYSKSFFRCVHQIYLVREHLLVTY